MGYDQLRGARLRPEYSEADVSQSPDFLFGKDQNIAGLEEEETTYSSEGDLITKRALAGLPDERLACVSRI